MEKKRIELIDYLKAICVTMVIFTHYDWSEKCTPLFTMFINMAVPVFMILSGYNFAMSGKKHRRRRRPDKIRQKEPLLPKARLFCCSEYEEVPKTKRNPK